jgi:parallel beta-helix repeat protein
MRLNKFRITAIILFVVFLGQIIIMGANAASVAAADSSAEDKAAATYVCDGTNDEVEIEAAINATADGGTVTVYAGNYAIQSSGRTEPQWSYNYGILVYGKSGLTINGAGNSTTIFKVPDGQNLDFPMLFARLSHNLTIKNICFDGNSQNQNTKKIFGLYIYHCNNTIVENMLVKNTSMYAIDIDVVCYHSTVRYNTVETTTSTGHGIAFHNGGTGYIGHNYINNTDRYGVLIDSTADTLVEANTMNVCFYGVSVSDTCSNITIEGNTITGTDGNTGISIQGASNTNVNNNTVSGGCTTNGIFVDSSGVGCSNIQVYKNNILGIAGATAIKDNGTSTEIRYNYANTKKVWLSTVSLNGLCHDNVAASIQQDAGSTTTAYNNSANTLIYIEPITYTVEEQDITLTFNVHRFGHTDTLSSTVDYDDNPDTATPPADYDAASGTLTFNTDDLVEQFSVAINLNEANNDNGTFRIRLSGATNAGIGSQDNITISITDTTEAVADFTASVTSGQAPLQCSFVSISTGILTQYLWQATRDGTIVWTSTEANPTTTFEAGTYTIALTVSNDGGSDTMTQTDMITVEYSTTGEVSGEWVTRTYELVFIALIAMLGMFVIGMILRNGEGDSSAILPIIAVLIFVVIGMMICLKFISQISNIGGM